MVDRERNRESVSNILPSRENARGEKRRRGKSVAYGVRETSTLKVPPSSLRRFRRRVFRATLSYPLPPAPGISILKRKKDSISREVSAPINHPSLQSRVRSASGRESSLARAARTGAPDRDDDAKMAVRMRGGGKADREVQEGWKSERRVVRARGGNFVELQNTRKRR